MKPERSRRIRRSLRWRLLLFALACLGIAACLPRVTTAMPPFGNHALPYGDAINRAAVGERHVTNMVTAVNFDYRGIDTLGEEIMLLSAVTGAAVLLRGHRGEDLGERPERVPGRPFPPRSEGLTLIGRLLGAVVVLFGLYVVLHAALTPGGGFQGGVIIASGMLLLFLGEGYQSWRGFMRAGWLDAIEGSGAAAYAIAGLVPMLLGAKFLQNVMPLGATRALLSGGLIMIVNWAVAFAVAGGFGILFLEFLEETRAPEGEQDGKRQARGTGEPAE